MLKNLIDDDETLYKPLENATIKMRNVNARNNGWIFSETMTWTDTIISNLYINIDKIKITQTNCASVQALKDATHPFLISGCKVMDGTGSELVGWYAWFNCFIHTNNSLVVMW